jgi:outer membrane protein assembly factor BamB
MSSRRHFLLSSLVVLLGLSSACRAADLDWPRYRGPNQDNVSPDKGLLQKWPEGGPPLVWTAKGLGGGYSSVTLSGDRIYTLGNKGRQSQLHAIDRQAGKVVWSTDVGAEGGNLGCTPTVDGDRIYTIGQRGDLRCVSSEGKILWQKNFVSDFGGTFGDWKYTESPLVDGDRLVCTPGGPEAAMVALDKNTGEVIWKCDAGLEKPEAGYSSIVVAEVGGVRLYIQLLAFGVIGVRAEDGKLLWKYEKLGRNTANIPTPIVRGDTVFSAAGYGKGGALLRMKREGDGVSVSEVYFNRSLTNKHGGLVIVGEHIFGDRDDNGKPYCAELTTGKVLWVRGREGRGSGSASVTYADGKLYFLYEDGVIALVEPSPEGYKEVSAFKLPGNGGRAWAHPVVVGGKMYLRWGDSLLCYDVSAEK